MFGLLARKQEIIKRSILANFEDADGELNKAIDIYTPESLMGFAEDLQKALDDGEINSDDLEKAIKDLTKLQKKIITNSAGHQQTVYVRVHEDGAEHHFKHEDKVKFKHGDKDVVGHIKSLKHHDKYDKFGTAEIHDEEGNKYSKSLRHIEHHHVPEFHTSEEGKKIISLAKELGFEDWAKLAEKGEIDESQMKYRSEEHQKMKSEGKDVIVKEKPDDKPKLSGVEAINSKQKQLKAIEDQIKNHDTGVKKVEDDELKNLKEKAKLIKTIIGKLQDKTDK